MTFPTMLRWVAAGQHGKEWWRQVILTDATEVCVIERDNQIAAFSVLITNERIWKKERSFVQRGFKSYFVGAVLHPLVVIRHNLLAFRSILLKGRQPVVYAAPSRRQWSPETRTWIELIATRPDMQGLGLGRMLLEHCERVTKDLGRTAIGLRVGTTNHRAKSLYTAQGFSCLRSDSKGQTYAKFIERG